MSRRRSPVALCALMAASLVLSALRRTAAAAQSDATYLYGNTQTDFDGAESSITPSTAPSLALQPRTSAHRGTGAPGHRGTDSPSCPAG